MDNIVNRIGEPEQERLGLFTEETGEANQIVGKILRHGLDSYHPDMPLLSNANLLELEAGHVLAAIDLLVACGTLDGAALLQARKEKLQKLRSWLHCGVNLDAVEELLREEPGFEEPETSVERNHREASEHRCDGTNIAQAPDGTFYCAHCGWNDPTPEGNR